jgi:hypothetical protein
MRMVEHGIGSLPLTVLIGSRDKISLQIYSRIVETRNMPHLYAIATILSPFRGCLNALELIVSG